MIPNQTTLPTPPPHMYLPNLILSGTFLILGPFYDIALGYIDGRIIFLPYLSIGIRYYLLKPFSFLLRV